MDASGRVEATFSGTVQGVGFRATTHRIASSLPVSGFVKNLEDGRVLLIAEGEREDLESLVEKVRSRMGSLIRDADLRWGGARGEFDSFSIRF